MTTWARLETAPIIDAFKEAPPSCLLYGKGVGIHIGQAWRSHGGQVFAQATGLHGDWPFTHWMPLPEPPEESAKTTQGEPES